MIIFADCVIFNISGMKYPELPKKFGGKFAFLTKF